LGRFLIRKPLTRATAVSLRFSSWVTAATNAVLGNANGIFEMVSAAHGYCTHGAGDKRGCNFHRQK
jgi:hypothetical protein